MNIKAIIYARYSTSAKIHSIINEGVQGLSADIDKLPQKIKALKARTDERDKLKTQYGVWYVTHDNNDVSYAVCTSQTYPERHAYAMIQKLQAKIGQINHCEYQSEQNIRAYSKKTAQQLVMKYNDLSKLDKLAKAQQQVQGLKDEIGVGVKKLMVNQESLNTMSDKAERMKNYAQQFQHNADKLEKLLYWRNCKIKILVGLCLVGILGFIILVIIQKTKS